MEKIHRNTSKSTLQNKLEQRDQVELLRSRVNLLNGKDRLIMTMYLENSNSFRQIGRLAGVKDTSIARRIDKIIGRLTNGKYVLCLRSRDKLTVTEMAIAKEYFVLGLSIRKIAAKRRWTYYRASRVIRKIHKTLQNNNQQNRI